MTSINFGIAGNRGFLSSDTAVYTVDGEIQLFRDKIEILDQHRIALACRGHYMAGTWLAEDIAERFSDFDALLAEAEPFVREFHETHDLEVTGADDHMDVAIVGWSRARRRAEGYHLSTKDRRTIGGPAPYHLMKNDWSFAMDPGPDKLRAAGILGPRGIIGDPETVLPTVAEIQRSTGADYVGRHLHLVGGELVLATVREDGVRKRVLKSWGDQVGQVITPQPHNVVPLAEPAVGMSRQQRRAAEREARRARA